LLKTRLIACLILRDGLIVQSIGFNKYLPIGHPKFSIEFLTQWDVDEIILLDISATAENRSLSFDTLELLSQFCTVPLTVGGGIKDIEVARKVIRSGADKLCINAEALKNPNFISEIALRFGSQCAVVSMDCRKDRDGKYFVYSDSGQKRWEMEAVDWAVKAAEAGAGEIFLNSIDRDGSRLGYDLDLISAVSSNVSVPVIACGGVGQYNHFSAAVLHAGAEAVAAANIFHYVEHSAILAKANMLNDGVNVRLDSHARYDKCKFDKFGRLIMQESEYLDIESPLERVDYEVL